jgi:hypothetical protein
MTRKLLMTAVVVAISLTPLISIGTADAHGGGAHGGGAHGGGFRDRGFFGGRGFRGNGFRGDVFGFDYPRYYGYGSCYLTVYGTTYCY